MYSVSLRKRPFSTLFSLKAENEMSKFTKRFTNMHFFVLCTLFCVHTTFRKTFTSVCKNLPEICTLWWFIINEMRMLSER